MILKEKTVGIRICTSCTLNCELCAANSPLYMQKGVRYFVSMPSYKRELEKLFQVYAHIGTISITGGEPLLHTQLAEIVDHTLQTYASQFNDLRITTNGTLLPSEELVNVIQKSPAKGKCLFIVDDYGEVSKQVPQLVKTLEENNLRYRVNCYHGENQHCNGWVDFGPIDQYRNYSEEEVQSIVHRCHFANWKCMDCFEGKLYLCTLASCGDYFHYFSLGPDEFIDLFDESQLLEKKQEIAASFSKKAIKACQYCNGFDTEKSPRFPAGRQIGGN